MGDVTAGVVCVAQTIGGDSLYGCLTDGGWGRRKGSAMDPLLTLEEEAELEVRASLCPIEQLSSWARQMGGDSAAIPGIHCPRTSRSSLVFGNRQLLCLDSQWGQR